MDQIVQELGSLLVLSAFVLAQRGRLPTDSRAYLALNLAGAGVLAVLAAHERQLGFLILEACWALVAGRALIRTGRATPRSGVRSRSSRSST
jgi:hypothetical protein